MSKDRASSQDEEVNSRVAENIRQIRDDLGLSRRKVQTLTSEYGSEIHLTTLRRLEEGSQPIRASEIVTLSRIYGVSVESILDTRRFDTERILNNIQRVAQNVTTELEKMSNYIKMLPAGVEKSEFSDKVKSAQSAVGDMTNF